MDSSEPSSSSSSSSSSTLDTSSSDPSSPPLFHQTTDSIPRQEGRLYNILNFNDNYVTKEEYKNCHTLYRRDWHGNQKRMVIVTCMDTRLTYLLPLAMNLKENDAKIIKNAGAVITHPFGGIMRSVMVAIYSLDADEVFVIGHHDCGMTRVDATTTLGNMIKKGIARHTLVTMQYSGIDIHGWLSGFKSVEDSVANSVDIIRNHPLMPISIPVHGLVIDPYTGRLELVVDGYKEMPVLTGGMPLAQSEWLKSIPSFDEPTEDEARKVVGGGGGGGGGEDQEDSIMKMHERAIASVAVRARSISSLSEGGGGNSTSIDSVTSSVSSLAVTAATPPEAPPVAPAIAQQMQRSSSSTSLSSSSLSSSSSTISSSLSQPFAHLGIELREQQKAVMASATGVESPNSQSIGSSTMSIGRAANRQRKPVVFSGAGMGIN